LLAIVVAAGLLGAKMKRPSRGPLVFLAAICAVIALGIVFPRVGLFAELMAREIRLLWWLFLLIGLGIYFGFFKGRKRD
jgi:hypothetical protein